MTGAGLMDNSLRADGDALNFNFLVMDTADVLSSPKITHHCVVHRVNNIYICIEHAHSTSIPMHTSHIHTSFMHTVSLCTINMLQ